MLGMGSTVVLVAAPHRPLLQPDVEHEPRVMAMLDQPGHLIGVGVEPLANTHDIDRRREDRQGSPTTATAGTVCRCCTPTWCS